MKLALPVLVLVWCAAAGAEPNFEVLTVLSKKFKISCDMMASSVHNNISLHVVGWGDQKLTVTNMRKKEERLKQKIPLLYNYIKDWPSDTVITFVDGGDVLFQAGVPEIRAGYYNVATEQRPIVFSAERQCWMKSLPPETCALWPKPKNSPYRYLNSGAWSGPVGKVKPLMEYAMSTFKKFDPRTCIKCGDQAVFGQAYFLDGWNSSIALDHNTEIAVNLFGGRSDFYTCNTQYTGTWKTCPTGRVAPIVHFNGLPKHPSLNATMWKRRMHWGKARLPRDAKIRINGVPTPLLELCPELPFEAEEGSRGQGSGESRATVPRPAQERERRIRESGAVAGEGGLLFSSADEDLVLAAFPENGELLSRVINSRIKPGGGSASDRSFLFGLSCLCACLCFFVHLQYKSRTSNRASVAVLPLHSPHDSQSASVTRRSPKS
ncbi:Procollagen-lysine [Diplonema papillatum]|nr:Procollagen-lysine [Diplonema papillatum]